MQVFASGSMSEQGSQWRAKNEDVSSRAQMRKEKSHALAGSDQVELSHLDAVTQLPSMFR